MQKSLINPFDPFPGNKNDKTVIKILRKTYPNWKKHSFC